MTRIEIVPGRTDRNATLQARWNKAQSEWSRLTESEQQAILAEVDRDDHERLLARWERQAATA